MSNYNGFQDIGSNCKNVFPYQRTNVKQSIRKIDNFEIQLRHRRQLPPCYFWQISNR